MRSTVDEYVEDLDAQHRWIEDEAPGLVEHHVARRDGNVAVMLRRGCGRFRSARTGLHGGDLFGDILLHLPLDGHPPAEVDRIQFGHGRHSLLRRSALLVRGRFQLSRVDLLECLLVEALPQLA
jgi:hypothetical protein